MKKHLHVGITDLIEWLPNLVNFNNELIIIDLFHSGEEREEHNRSVQIDAFSLILILNGVMDITINGQDYKVCTKAFIDVFDFHAVRNVRISSDFRGYHIVVARSFMDEVMRNLRRIPVSNFLSRCDHPVMELEDEESTLLEHFMQNIIRNIHRTDHVCQRDIVKNEVRNLFAEILNITIHRNKPIDADIYKNKEEIIAQFIHLVKEECKEEHSVRYYADKLCVDPKYLSRIFKAVSGKTANQFIDEAIITEAKMLLNEQEMTLAEIADQLHFSDQSSFGKFFKKCCGLSPLNFRRGLY